VPRYDEHIQLQLLAMFLFFLLIPDILPDYFLIHPDGIHKIPRIPKMVPPIGLQLPILWLNILIAVSPLIRPTQSDIEISHWYHN
jgi:hypothetical protein